MLLGVLAVCVGVGCGSTARSSRPPDARRQLLDRVGNPRPATGDDRFEVWVCHVPLDTAIALYDPGVLRVAVRPEALAVMLTSGVGAYFDTISGGLYHPVFTPGGEIDLGRDDDSQRCAAQALDRAHSDTAAVLLIADAQHAADQPGGWGRGPNPGCELRRCSAGVSRRAVYVGAADFHSDWGANPPLDLVEHEIGHSLGWPHSARPGTSTSGAAGRAPVDVAGPGDGDGEHASSLDLMSDSAAPRRIDAERRDGPDVLALDRLIAGWLDPADVVTVTATTGRLAIVPSARAGSGPRLAVANGTGHQVVTIEAIEARGYDDHLAADGIAIHVVDLAADPLVSIVATRVGVLVSGDVWEESGLRVRVISATEIEIGRSGG